MCHRIGELRTHLLLPLLALFLAGAVACPADDAVTLPDIAGIYRTDNPVEGEVPVYLRFVPTGDTITYNTTACPAYDVSRWRITEDGPLKVRDGLFETFTQVALVEDRGGRYLLWHSPPDNVMVFNEMVHLTSTGNMLLGAGEPGTNHANVTNVLIRMPDDTMEPERAPADLALPGIYRYRHPVTGSIYVLFEPSNLHVPVAPGQDVPACVVSVLSRVGEIGYTPVREGLYGGSVNNDSYRLVAVHTDADGQWLCWYNPAAPGKAMRTRIVSRYANGDIGIAPPGNNSRYVEDSVFRRVDDADARVAPIVDFVDLPGTYLVTVGESGPSQRVVIRETDILVQQNTTSGIRLATADPAVGAHTVPLYEIMRFESRALPGLYPGDPYTHVGLTTRNGRGYFTWYSFSHDAAEENLVFEVEQDGSFLIVGGEFGKRYVVARFAREEEVRGDTEAPGSAAVSEASPGVPTTHTAACGDGLFQPDPDAAWTSTELGALRLAARLFPAGLQPAHPVRISRDPREFVPGVTQGEPATGRTTGEISIRPIVPPPELVSVPGQWCAAFLMRSLIRCLAQLAWSELPREQQETWRTFALWSPGILAPTYPENTNPDGYAHSRGMLSPGEDFAAFAVEVLVTPDYRDPQHDVRVRLPDRYAFFIHVCGGAPLAHGSPFYAGVAANLPVRAPTLEDWINPDDVEHVELIVSTPTANAPESLAGHLLLLIRRRGDFADSRDSTVVGFVGITSLDSANGVTGVRYAWRGLTGYYDSAIQEETFEELVQRATVLENRDVQRYRLRLSREEIERLVERLWVVRNTFTYQYRFFGVNCASMLMDLLNHAFDEESRIPYQPPIVAPLHVVAVLDRNGRLDGPVYPEYWSLGKNARRATVAMTGIRAEILALVPNIVRDQVSALLDTTLSVAPGEVRPDPLFRELVLVSGGATRATAYGDLCDLFMGLAVHVDSGELSVLDHDLLAELLLRFYMHAWDRELALAVPDEVIEGHGSANPVAEEVARDELERQLRDVQLRRRNSQELQSLRRALSCYRISLDNTSLDTSRFLIGREIREETTESLSRTREDAGRTHGYYSLACTASVVTRSGGLDLGARLDATLYREEMGHGSVFALKRDMRMNVLSFGATLTVGVAYQQPALTWREGGNTLGFHATVFDFQKVLTGSDPDYTGRFSPGFGFTLLEGAAIARDDLNDPSEIDFRLRPLELRAILNLAEQGEFTHYLNLAAGCAWEFARTGGTYTSTFAFPVDLEAKVHPGGSRETALRLALRYEPALTADATVNHYIEGGCELDYSPGRHPYSLRTLGVRITWCPGGIGPDPTPEAEFFTRFR